MLRRTVLRAVRLKEDPVPTDTRAFYTWFSSQAYRQDVNTPGGYPAIRIYPAYGKRWVSGKTFFAFLAGISLYGGWARPEKDRYNTEMQVETNERHATHLPYQTAEINLRMLVTGYKRFRYEQENLVDKGYVGLTSEFRKFFYHDDVWRPDLHDVLRHPYLKYGGPLLSYIWAFGYW